MSDTKPLWYNTAKEKDSAELVGYGVKQNKSAADGKKWYPVSVWGVTAVTHKSGVVAPRLARFRVVFTSTGYSSFSEAETAAAELAEKKKLRLYVIETEEHGS